MSSALFRLARTLKLIAFMLTDERMPRKIQLLAAYLKLKLKGLRYSLIPKAGPVQEKIFGFRVESFNYPLLLFLFEEIFVDGEYYFSSRYEAPVIFDLGANVGLASLFFKWLYPKARIVAFEADDQAFQLLKRNVEANHLPGVEVHNKAVSDSAGLIQFHYDSEADGLGQLSMSIRGRPGLKDSKSVAAIRLSDYVQEEVDFLKIDIEGAEGLVIRDLARSGKLRCIREITMEYHHHITSEDDALSEVLATLEQNGFGYQIATLGRRKAFRRGEFQGLLLHAYRR